MNRFYELSSRERIPVYEKFKIVEKGSSLVNHKKEKKYDYYKCDYCGAEIKIIKKRQEMTGGTITIWIGYNKLDKKDKDMLK